MIVKHEELAIYCDKFANADYFQTTDDKLTNGAKIYNTTSLKRFLVQCHNNNIRSTF